MSDDSTTINLSSELFQYFEDRLQLKRDIESEVSSNYPLQIGKTFSEYGSKIKDLWGNDLFGYTAADALMSYGYDKGDNVYDNRFIIGYGGYTNRGLLRGLSYGKPVSTEIVFSGVTDLEIDSPAKFDFWFLSGAYSFPDLSCLIIKDLEGRSLKQYELIINGKIWHYEWHPSGGRDGILGTRIFNYTALTPNLKKVSQNIIDLSSLCDGRIGIDIDSSVTPVEEGE